MTDKKAASFPLRMPRTMQMQIRDLARKEGISLNQFINIALAEKIVRLSSLDPVFGEGREPIRGSDTDASDPTPRPFDQRLKF
jgi:hypothetical protein